MRFAAALMLISFAAHGQTAPPEVDQELRARVTEFFGYHVSGKFMKAYELVAEDTKESYFAAQKNLFLAFTVGDIAYSDNFTKAVVNVVTKRKFRPSPQFPEIVIDQATQSTWKIENGKWFYYTPPVLSCPTPMSCGPDGKPRPVLAPAAPGDNAPNKLPDVSPNAVNQQAQQILKQSKVDKPEIAMSSAGPTSERVMFHNGQPGYVRVYVSLEPNVEGFSATVEKTDLKADEDVAITLHYQPGAKPAPLGLIVKVQIEPLGQIFPIMVKFTR